MAINASIGFRFFAIVRCRSESICFAFLASGSWECCLFAISCKTHPQLCLSQATRRLVRTSTIEFCFSFVVCEIGSFDSRNKRNVRNSTVDLFRVSNLIYFLCDLRKFQLTHCVYLDCDSDALATRVSCCHTIAYKELSVRLEVDEMFASARSLRLALVLLVFY